jgi:hypothetical protein
MSPSFVSSAPLHNRLLQAYHLSLYVAIKIAGYVFPPASFQEFDVIHVVLEIEGSEMKLNSEQDWFTQTSATNTRCIPERRSTPKSLRPDCVDDTQSYSLKYFQQDYNIYTFTVQSGSRSRRIVLMETMKTMNGC